MGAGAKGPTAAYVREVLAFFDAGYPEAACALKFGNPFQLLAATVLSAQCTDARVNLTTPALFARFPGPADLAQADLGEVEDLVRPCGFYRHKARHLVELSLGLCRDHGGEVPRTLEELVALPGVGRKTANVVLGNAFGQPGLTVDTHLARLSRRLGLSAGRNPEEIEADLARLIPPARWTLFSHQAIAHGRAVCRARRPACEECRFESCPRLI
ncbi:MAG: endonuclease III [Candidatus Adiutrix sp.]|jgi:endonuclease-3|nr:endonuclease III [Candidatus Adiutrix sp.]